MQEGNAANAESASPTGRLIIRNTLFLVIAQLVGMPISFVISAVTARYLGPDSLGKMYLSTTMCGFAFLVIDWGHNGALPALVARERSRAGALLGTSLAWRAFVALPVYLAVSIITYVLGYSQDLRLAVSLAFIGFTLCSFANAGQDTILGFERTDVAAMRQVGELAAVALIVIPVLMLGGGLKEALIAHAFTALAPGLIVTLRMRSIPIGRPSFDRSVLRELLVAGTPFVFFNLAMILQPNVDAIFLSKLSSAEVVGWFAASRRITGMLLFPSTAMMGALYPTLSRLQGTDPDGYLRTARGALIGTSMLVIPVALGCALYPEIGVAIYGRSSYGPAEDNLRMLSPFIFLVYFTMPLGLCILSSGGQRVWALVQSLCVVISSVLDPLLVPWFQRHFANGGLGIGASMGVSELTVCCFGMVLAPRGIVNAPFFRSVGLAVTSGLAMVGVAQLLRGISPFLAAPLAVVAYAVALWLTGAIDPSYLEAVSNYVRRKFDRNRS